MKFRSRLLLFVSIMFVLTLCLLYYYTDELACASEVSALELQGDKVYWNKNEIPQERFIKSQSDVSIPRSVELPLNDDADVGLHLGHDHLHREITASKARVKIPVSNEVILPIGLEGGSLEIPVGGVRADNNLSNIDNVRRERTKTSSTPSTTAFDHLLVFNPFDEKYISEGFNDRQPVKSSDINVTRIRNRIRSREQEPGLSEQLLNAARPKESVIVKKTKHPDAIINQYQPERNPDEKTLLAVNTKIESFVQNTSKLTEIVAEVEMLRNKLSRLSSELSLCKLKSKVASVDDLVPIDDAFPSNWSDHMNSLSEFMKYLPDRVPPKSQIPVSLNIYNNSANRSGNGEIFAPPAWYRLHNNINQFGLYGGPDDPLLKEILHNLATLPIIDIYEMPDKGTQIKHAYLLRDQGRAMFKPMRVSRDYETPLDLYYMYHFERHTAEIAAFHLDRILGHRRVPPTVGRTIHMIKELYTFASEGLKETFYVSPTGNQCFYGICEYFCDPGHGVCGKKELLEGSFAFYLPSKIDAPQRSIKNPWARAYSKHNTAEWEGSIVNGQVFCMTVRNESPYDRDTPLLDVIDVHIFDFLMGNPDRHHWHQFKKFDDTSFLILYDNGKGFGNANNDDRSILAPLYQCCMIRRSTFDRLIQLDKEAKVENVLDGYGNIYPGNIYPSDLSGTLGTQMKQSLAKDSLEEVLTHAHLRALNRRVKVILVEVNKCILDNENDVNNVVIDDGGSGPTVRF